jgi:DNA polymerase-4
VRLKQRVRAELGLTISLGIGASKLIAQIAAKLRKPDALVEVPRGTEREFLAPLESRWLPGVGPKLFERLQACGLRTIGDVADASPADLQKSLAATRINCGAYALGLDDRPVVVDREDAKSTACRIHFSKTCASATASSPFCAAWPTSSWPGCGLTAKRFAR